MAGPEETPDAIPNGVKRVSPDVESLPRKKFKTEELPLSATQHTAIENLLHSFKKKGGFDNVRKKIWADFDSGVCRMLFFLWIIRILTALLYRNQKQSLRSYWLTWQIQKSIASRSSCHENEVKQRL